MGGAEERAGNLKFGGGGEGEVGFCVASGEGDLGDEWPNREQLFF